MKLVIRHKRSSNPRADDSSHEQQSSSELQAQIIGSSNACEVIRQRGCAVKILRGDNVDLLVHEYSILKSLDHKNIIKLASSKPFKMCKEREKIGLTLELGHIDLFDLLKQAQPSTLNTSTVRLIFQSIAKALHYIHTEKLIAHNDIKLQNILLFFNPNDSSDLTAKLIDFGLASSVSEDSSTICKNWGNRSPNNLPPEIIEILNTHSKETDNTQLKIEKPQENYHKCNNFTESSSQLDLSKCDVFQFGLTLFNAIFLSNPFECINGNSSYQYFLQGNPELFWSLPVIQNLLNNYLAQLSIFQNINGKSDNTLQEQINQLIDLFNQLFAYYPSQRPSMQDILNHPWFKA